MFKTLCAFAVFAAALALTGCKSKEQADAEAAAVKAEQDKLQGKWKFTTRAGDADPEDEDEKEDKPEPTSYLAYSIDGDILKEFWVDKDGKETVFVRYKLTVVPNKDPNQVDLTEVDEAGKPVTETRRTSSKGKTKTKKTTVKYMGIYKIEGDKLSLCISYDDKKRPADFDPKKGSRSYAVTLEKMK